MSLQSVSSILRKTKFKLSTFRLILLPQPSRRAPALNQYCFSSFPTPESVDFEKILNYLHRVLHSRRERATTLTHFQLMMASTSCCILLQKSLTVKTFCWWRSKSFYYNLFFYQNEFFCSLQSKRKTVFEEIWLFFIRSPYSVEKYHVKCYRFVILCVNSLTSITTEV